MKKKRKYGIVGAVALLLVFICDLREKGVSVRL